MLRSEGGTSTHGECSTMKNYMLQDEFLLKRNLLILSQNIGVMMYFMGTVSGSGPGWPSCTKEKKRIEEAYYSFMHAPLGSGGRA